MTFEAFIQKAFDRPRLVWPVLLAATLLGGLFALNSKLQKTIRSQEARLEQGRHGEEQLMMATFHYQSLRDLKAQDVRQFKAGMTDLARSNRSLFETSLALHEEKRVLEKQWEILTTYLILNCATQRVVLMKGDQSVDSYPLTFAPPRAVGEIPETMPSVVRIVSKERFAHPERGQAKEVNGKLQWDPPQVGTSVRANALGEFVIFTNSKLILHGPPLRAEDHEAFPHLCVGLSLNTARKLYRNSFVGTKIVLVGAPSPAARIPVTITTPTVNPPPVP